MDQFYRNLWGRQATFDDVGFQLSTLSSPKRERGRSKDALRRTGRRKTPRDEKKCEAHLLARFVEFPLAEPYASPVGMKRAAKEGKEVNQPSTPSSFLPLPLPPLLPSSLLLSPSHPPAQKIQNSPVPESNLLDERVSIRELFVCEGEDGVLSCWGDLDGRRRVKDGGSSEGDDGR